MGMLANDLGYQLGVLGKTDRKISGEMNEKSPARHRWLATFAVTPWILARSER